ncbi:hypothetical protein B0H15DRAFT_1026452 [Mycena belliarum]|uniref:Uncharacterized protein n=1 Tax=Mycena belliarum TaxID=1033014 RepID=A0AAD6TU57_9AGAR|nr:hypothetical protein B0H15DRAFT_1026452 [Mycena belliae]
MGPSGTERNNPSAGQKGSHAPRTLGQECATIVTQPEVINSLGYRNTVKKQCARASGSSGLIGGYTPTQGLGAALPSPEPIAVAVVCIAPAATLLAARLDSLHRAVAVTGVQPQRRQSHPSLAGRTSSQKRSVRVRRRPETSERRAGDLRMECSPASRKRT